MEQANVFTLSSLLAAGDVTIQCHDNPDADAIAAAFAVYTYLTSAGQTARIIYTGRFPITKLNLLEMIQLLSIPIKYVKKAPAVEMLVVVDGQYGTENVTRVQASTVITIDHHEAETEGSILGIVDPLLGSCSTLVWDLLRKEGFSLEMRLDVATALYYGLYSDTSGFSEIYHPLDKDLRDFIPYDRHVVKLLCDTNVITQEMSINGLAPAICQTEGKLRYSFFKSESGDPNVLSYISELALTVDGVDVCVAYSSRPGGTKLSVRSGAREVMAFDFAEFLTVGAGFSGGCVDKASGYIRESAATALGVTADELIEARAHEYFVSYDIINAASHNLDLSTMARYKKKNIPVGHVLSTDVFEPGAPIVIRTLEGDTEATVSDDVYIMVGIWGETYMIKAEKFRRSYQTTDEALVSRYSYSPTARNRVTGEVKDLTRMIRPCVALGAVTVLARPVDKKTKVFTSWNRESYMLGKPTDYLVVRSDDVNDVYIVMREIFDLTYEPII